jgi:acetyl-CoA C-acetyltransferase
MASLERATAIVGINEFSLRVAPGYSSMQIEAECARAALDDAGLTLADVDGYFGVTAPVEATPSLAMCDYLNIHPNIVDSTNVGGASFLLHVMKAASYIQAGLMKVGLITYAQCSRSRGVAVGTGESGFHRHGPRRVPWWSGAFKDPFGLVNVASYAQVAARHMYEYGTTSEQMAEIAVAARYNAGFNPDAMYRVPITVEDVVSSRMVCWPLHLLDCCVISDGGGAVVVASPEVARDCMQSPVWLLGGAMAVEHKEAGYHDYARIAAARSGPEAFARTGLKHDDIDVAMLYDSYTITIISTLEGLGFCGFGEGGAFVQSHNLRWDGDFPMNTDGGGMSSNQPNARGIFLLIEATRQLRGQAEGRQVQDPRIAICHGTGGGGLGNQHSGVTIFLANN